MTGVQTFALPISWYEKAEKHMGVTGPSTGMAYHPWHNSFKVLATGAKRAGYKEILSGPMAINTEPYDDRAACQQIGFCMQGCKMGAKWSTLYTEIPAAEATGKLELRTQAQVLRIEHDARGRASAVVYADAEGRLQRQKARLVAVSSKFAPRRVVAFSASRSTIA